MKSIEGSSEYRELRQGQNNLVAKRVRWASPPEGRNTIQGCNPNPHRLKAKRDLISLIIGSDRQLAFIKFKLLINSDWLY